MKPRAAGLLARLALALVSIPLLVPGNALAAGPTASGSATVVGGPLSLDEVTPITFPSVTLDGGDQLVCTQPPANVPANTLPVCSVTGTQASSIRVTDATGSYEGWHVSVSATPWIQLCTPNPCNPVHQIPIVNSTIQVDEVQAADSVQTDSVIPPVNHYTGPTAVPDSGTVPIFDAAAGTGVGSFDLWIQWGLLIPASTYAGLYQNTATFTLTQGP